MDRYVGLEELSVAVDARVINIAPGLQWTMAMIFSGPGLSKPTHLLPALPKLSPGQPPSNDRKRISIPSRQATNVTDCVAFSKIAVGSDLPRHTSTAVPGAFVNQLYTKLSHLVNSLYLPSQCLTPSESRFHIFTYGMTTDCPKRLEKVRRARRIEREYFKMTVDIMTCLSAANMAISNIGVYRSFAEP